jgi:hypothetical protein
MKAIVKRFKVLPNGWRSDMKQTMGKTIEVKKYLDCVYISYKKYGNYCYLSDQLIFPKKEI